jgi:molybdate transport system regulatory protein
MRFMPAGNWLNRRIGVTTSLMVHGDIWMGRDAASMLGDLRISLLEQIAKTGSITQAAKAVGVSYKTAWDAVDAMKNVSGFPVVESVSGGIKGGGTRLTEEGLRLVETYRLLQQEHERFLSALSNGIKDFRNFYPLIRRLSMKSSARNQFFGRVTTIKKGAVNDEVEIALNGEDRITAIITQDSTQNLGLAVGSEVWALIKASWVILVSDNDTLRISARNRLRGTVSRITRGAVNSEVIVTLSGGNTVCAIVTNDSVEEMGLAEGSKVCAVFKASSVILGVAM